MSSSTDPLNLNPAIVDSLGTATDFKKVLDILDFKSVLTPSTFTNFLEGIRNAMPGSHERPVLAVGTYQVWTPQGYKTNSITVPVELTAAQNFDPNDILKGCLALFHTGGYQFYNLAGFTGVLDFYLQNYYNNYGTQIPEIANAVRNATLQTRLDAQQKYHTAVTPSVSVTFKLSFTTPSIIGSGMAKDLQGDITSAGTIAGMFPTAGTGKVGEAFLNSFLKNFTYPPNNAPVTTQYFMSEMTKAAKQFAVTAVLTDTATGSTQIDTLEPYLLKYKAVYDALFPNADAAAGTKAYNEDLKAFYKDEIKKYGPYVTPSQAFADWISFTRKKYLSVYLPTDFTSLSSQNAKKTLIINDIYALIHSMVESIQKVAAAQATRLVLLTEWQKAYSDSLTMVPTFLQNEYEKIDSGNRAAMNTQGQQLIQNMQTQQALVGDDAKALQSNINQSNDAVSQQANMAQSLLQELNTILAAIFK